MSVVIFSLKTNSKASVHCSGPACEQRPRSSCRRRRARRRAPSTLSRQRGHTYMYIIYTDYVDVDVYVVVHVCVCRGDLCTYIHTYIHTYVRTYIHTYIHTYMHTYIHTCMHTYTQIMRVHMYRFHYVDIPRHIRRCTNTKPAGLYRASWAEWPVFLRLLGARIT